VAYQAWRGRAAALRAAQPNETLWLRNEMFAIQRLGDLALSGGATAEASALFADTLARAEQFAAARPADAIGAEAQSLLPRRAFEGRPSLDGLRRGRMRASRA
jgi:hypothetical protein